MNDVIDSPPSPSAGWPPPVVEGERPTPVAAPRRQRTGWHIAAIVVGCLALLPGFGMLAGGGALAVAQAVATDDDGYFTVTIDRLGSDGVAIVATDVWFDGADDDAPWIADFVDLDLRLRVQGAADTDDVFVGIARTADVDAYLGDAARSELTELDGRAPRYRERDGASSVVAPLDPEIAEIWDATAAGTGEQELTWEARGGKWSIVVMNADGSADVAADVEVGGRSGLIVPVAITLIVVGGLLTAGAVVLVVIGARGRRTVTGVDPAVPVS